jgi:hypothetical protein
MINQTEKQSSLEEIAAQMAREIEVRRERRARLFTAVREMKAKLAVQRAL